mmetsp:Transcript_2636/g.4374  ORF Transcript_2636/g.4374 Transcript_2636/m.4374 type:complete len:129 (+) Transcript_2636:59-445(+)|eukprot:CAMPEP_0184522812 /NCGR_PEP_ID=MMETSP0198_2-20121128/8499_1 /TAXON_ID=1112570 /ORGANISM="Thraustochytrium sp., Strain LLF1b" /LENGTH=128 /DNA_ID=CAMNT_0026913699 /DNA_START=277 /DNA_END=663 /DNA_ORIENTATION=+
MGSCCSQEENGPQDGIDGSRGDSDLLVPIELPPGWKAVPSRSRPGKLAYQNVHTGERISWVPTEQAKTYKGAISKKKRKPTVAEKNSTATEDEVKASLVSNGADQKNGNGDATTNSSTVSETNTLTQA